MRNAFNSILLALAITCGGCSETTDPVKDQARYRVATGPGAWGFVDGTGKLVIPATLQHAEEFVGTTALVLMEDEFVLIDRSGQVIHNFGDLEFVARVTETLFTTSMNEEITLLTAPNSPNHRFEPPPDILAISIRGFDEGVIPVERAAGWGFASADGKIAIDCKYTWVNRFQDNLAAAALGDAATGYIDHTGQSVIPFDYLHGREFSDGVAPVLCKDELWRYITKENLFAFPGEFADARSFSNGLAVVVPKGSAVWRILNIDGKFINETEYSYLASYVEGLARYRIDKSDGTRVHGYLDTTGNPVLVYNKEVRLGDFVNGVALILHKERSRKSNYYELIDQEGSVLWSSRDQ